jgi:diadenosine tetraphosphate (Ap4A) HIT family hydrolase
MLEQASASAWSLHPQLARDTLVVGDLSLCRVLLMNDANYPWLLLVPRQPELVEVIDLGETARGQLMTEIGAVSEALKSVTACDKLNVAAIGNVVPQLHIHLVARFRSDPAWPKPVWGLLPPRAYEPAQCEQLMSALRGQLAFMSISNH